MSDSIEMRQLFAAYINGEITAGQLEVLEASLRDNPELRREFIEYMNIDSALDGLAALSSTEVAEIEAVENDVPASVSIPVVPPSDTNRLRIFGLVVGSAIAATLLIAVMFWDGDPTLNSDTTVATLVSTVDAALVYDGKPVSVNQISVGKYQLERGLINLKFRSGVMVYLEAPAHFDALSDQRVVLRSGRLSASVPPEGTGFTVETPEAEVIDFGTEFSVEVDSGASEIHVFDGLVRVQPRATSKAEKEKPIDLKTSQAVKIEGSEKPVEIELANDRFIRTFDEPKLRYPRAIKQLAPVAYYRMPIRDRGLAAEPPEYSGVVLTGDGIRPPHARGVSNGGSLRVLADSSGRGGLVDNAPPLSKGELTLAVFVYLEKSAAGGTLVTNRRDDQGNFALSLDEQGMLQASIRTASGEIVSASSRSPFPLQTWRHLILVVDGQQMQIYQNSQLVASSPCSLLTTSESDPLWIGTDASGQKLWNGRIDELALFDRALSAQEITELYPAAMEEMATTKRIFRSPNPDSL